MSVEPDRTEAARAEETEAVGAEETEAVGETAQPPSTRPPLEVLLDVQDLDTAISQLQHRKATLPERQELARVSAALDEVGTRLSEVQASRAKLADRQRAIEAEISMFTARREALEQRMYATRGAPARDLQAMDDEIRHLRERKDQMEDDELEVMVAIEPLDAELAVLDVQATGLRAEAGQLRSTAAAADAEIDAQLSVQVAARTRAAAALPEDLRHRYETLRSRLGGTGAARLIGNRCSGCHLELPSMEVDRIRHLAAGTVVTCEQCGRILVPVSSPAGR